MFKLKEELASRKKLLHHFKFPAEDLTVLITFVLKVLTHKQKVRWMLGVK